MRHRCFPQYTNRWTLLGLGLYFFLLYYRIFKLKLVLVLQLGKKIARMTPLALWTVFGFVCLNDQDCLLSHHTLTSILSTCVSSGGSAWLLVLVFPGLLLLKDQCLLCSRLQCRLAPRPRSSWHSRSLCPPTVQSATYALLPDCFCECFAHPSPWEL